MIIRKARPEDAAGITHGANQTACPTPQARQAGLLHVTVHRGKPDSPSHWEGLAKRTWRQACPDATSGVAGQLAWPVPFASTLLALLILLTSLLTACGDASNGLATATNQSQTSTQSSMAIGSFQEFALPQGKSGLMRPVLDGQGRLWFGEMNRNYLGSFDPQTGKFWQQTPPNGQFGIMGLVAAPDNTLWFAEQDADYIGHYFPASGQYKVYPLPTISTPDPSNAGKTLSLPSAPNDLVLDAHGTLWFTEINANAIGSLNTADGSIHHYPLSRDKSASNPYGIAADPQGIIWFSEASSKRLGRLDPVSGQVSYFTPPGVANPLMELASDAQGQVWATVFSSGQLLRFTPASQTFTLYNAPTLNSSSIGGLYGLALASNGDVWVTIGSENLLARLDVRAQRFITYAIPTPNSLPLGLVVDKDQRVWFTEGSSDKVGVLQP